MMDQFGMGDYRDEANERSVTDGLRPGKMERDDAEKSFEQLVKGVLAMLSYA